MAAWAPLVAPSMVLGAVAVFFIPMLSRSAPLIALGLLTVTPVALSIAWRPSGSAGQARRATSITAILLGMAAGGLGLLANPCVADPVVIGVVSVALFTGTLLAATWIGRAMARGAGLVAGAVAAGVIGAIGFYGSLIVIGEKVFVLC